MKIPRLISSSRTRQGFSLVEVAMALAIFSFAVMALIGLLPVAVNTHKEAKLQTVLSQIRQRLAAEVLLTDSTQLDSLNGMTRNFNNEGTELDTTSTDPVIYRAKIEVTNVTLPGSNAASTSLKRVQLFAVFDPTNGSTLLNQATPSASMLIPLAASTTSP